MATNRTRRSHLRRTRHLAEMPLTELISTARQRDEDAWAELVRRLEGVVWSKIRQSGIPTDRQDDIAAIVWLNFFERIERLRDPNYAPGWLATAARRSVVDHYRAGAKEWVDRESIDVETVEASARDARDHDSGLIEREVAAAVRSGLRCLGEREREIIRRRFLDDEAASYDAIAADLAIKRGSIGPTMARGLSKLQTHPAVMAVAS